MKTKGKGKEPEGKGKEIKEMKTNRWEGGGTQRRRK